MNRFPLIGVGVLIRKGDALLLIKRANSHGAGTWSTPGGHLDFGETPEECAVRETKEETGVVIRSPTFVGITNDIFVAEDKHYITVWMEGVYESGNPSVNAAYEMSDVQWFPEDNLPTPLFLPLQNLMDGNCYQPIQSHEISREE